MGRQVALALQAGRQCAKQLKERCPISQQPVAGQGLERLADQRLQAAEQPQPELLHGQACRLLPQAGRPSLCRRYCNAVVQHRSQVARLSHSGLTLSCPPHLDKRAVVQVGKLGLPAAAARRGGAAGAAAPRRSPRRPLHTHYRRFRLLLPLLLLLLFRWQARRRRCCACRVACCRRAAHCWRRRCQDLWRHLNKAQQLGCIQLLHQVLQNRAQAIQRIDGGGRHAI